MDGTLASPVYLKDLCGFSPVAKGRNIAMFDKYHFFEFFNSTWCLDEILTGWEVVTSLAFS